MKKYLLLTLLALSICSTAFAINIQQEGPGSAGRQGNGTFSSVATKSKVSTCVVCGTKTKNTYKYYTRNRPSFSFKGEDVYAVDYSCSSLHMAKLVNIGLGGISVNRPTTSSVGLKNCHNGYLYFISHQEKIYFALSEYYFNFDEETSGENYQESVDYFDNLKWVPLSNAGKGVALAWVTMQKLK